MDRRDGLAHLHAWWDTTDPTATARAIAAAACADEPPELPVLAWQLLAAVRRGAAAPDTATLADLACTLDRWEERHGLLDAPTPAGVLAQTLQVQDLHCLADLCTAVGQGWAAGAWSRRGHRLERALHARCWTGDGYADDGPAGALAVPLLLDTPPERVDRIAARAEAGCRAALAVGAPVEARLVAEGLRRHDRHAGLATRLAALVAEAARRR